MKIAINIFILTIIASCSYLKINSPKIKVQDNVFVEGSRDIALLSGMNKINEDNIGFDSNIGSISSVIYSFENNPEDLLEFYLTTLNQLGWKLVNENNNKTTSQKYNFQRDKENLSLEININDFNSSQDQQNIKIFKINNSINTVKFFFSSSL